jgi:hypothetical protein
MSDESKARADARLEAALGGTGRRDPRPSYRLALRYLKDRDPDGFHRARRYFEEELVPEVAGGADPLQAWTEYGRRLAEGLGPGRTMDLDATGRARRLEDPGDAAGLVLYVPDDEQAPVLVLQCPSEPSKAQNAALELLVDGRQTASAYP